MSVKERHTDYIRQNLPLGTTVYGLAKRGRDGVINGAKFYYITSDGDIENITSQIATVTDAKWNNVTGFMPTRAISDAVDLVGLRIHGKLTAYKYRDLP